VYLLSYVLASRSSDVSSQFRRLQPDQLQPGNAGGTTTRSGGCGGERCKGRIVRIRRTGRQRSRFLRQYLRNITPRRNDTYSSNEHSSSSSSSSSRIPSLRSPPAPLAVVSGTVQRVPGGLTSFAEIRGLRISRRRRMEFVCRDLHLNRVGARAHLQLDRSTLSLSLSLCSGTARESLSGSYLSLAPSALVSLRGAAAGKTHKSRRFEPLTARVLKPRRLL